MPAKKPQPTGTVLGALDIKNGISELCFYRVKKGAYTDWDSVNGGNCTDYIYDNALSVYVDEVRIRKFEIPDGVYFTFDKKPEATGTIGGTARCNRSAYARRRGSNLNRCRNRS